MCKRERDAQIFTAIKEWEREEVSKIDDSDQRKLYIKDLESKKKEITQMFEKTPQSIANKHKRWRIAADIE